MTIVKVRRKAGHIVSVSCMGHTMSAEKGEDIVCAALSSVVQTALMGLMEVAGINVDYTRDDEEGLLLIKLPEGIEDAQRHDADVILHTMLCGVSDLSEQFSKYIKLEVK